MAAPLLLLLCCVLLAGVQGDNGDFDLADALDDDKESTPRPAGEGLYPRLPQDLPRDPHDPGSVYPGPPRPHPQPHPRPPNGKLDGLGGGGSHGHEGETGSPVASIISPVISVIVLALLGAGAGYIRSRRGGNCLGRGRESQPV